MSDPTGTLATLAAMMGKTEDEVKAWIADTPNRHRRIAEKLSASPEFRAALAKHDHLARKTRQGG